jgi:hypothetical protein
MMAFVLAVKVKFGLHIKDQNVKIWNRENRKIRTVKRQDLRQKLKV